jgi:signal transduction histidine kinase
MIRDVMDEVRTIQNDLHPAYLDMMGLLVTMSDFCERFQAIYGQIHSTIQIDIAEKDVPDFLKVPIFRIYQEAMNNAAKHSRADRITAGIRREEDKIIVTIEDNGIGFDPNEDMAVNGDNRGLGLFSMLERAGLSGGSIKFITAKGEGTKIIGSWPIIKAPLQ